MSDLLIALLFGASVLGFAVSLIALFFKSYRRRAKWGALASGLAFIASIVLIVHAADEMAQAKGYLDAADQRAATEAGISDVASWRSQRQRVESKLASASELNAKTGSQSKPVANKIDTAAPTDADANRTAQAKSEKDRADAIEARASLLRPPLEQSHFVEVIAAAKSQYSNGTNELQKGSARPARASAICRVVPEERVTNWIGTIDDLSTNGDGDGVIAIKLGGIVQLATWNNSFSDYKSGTLVKAGSSLYRDLLTLKVRDIVRFSGTFFRNDTDCFSERSLTLMGSVTDPIFVFRFTRIERVVLPIQSAVR